MYVEDLAQVLQTNLVMTKRDISMDAIGYKHSSIYN
jgi:hypothetical protein